MANIYSTTFDDLTGWSVDCAAGNTATADATRPNRGAKSLKCHHGATGNARINRMLAIGKPEALNVSFFMRLEPGEGWMGEDTVCIVFDSVHVSGYSLRLDQTQGPFYFLHIGGAGFFGRSSRYCLVPGVWNHVLLRIVG
jgi:hypothetical protein